MPRPPASDAAPRRWKARESWHCGDECSSGGIAKSCAMWCAWRESLECDMERTPPRMFPQLAHPCKAEHAPIHRWKRQYTLSLVRIVEHVLTHTATAGLVHAPVLCE